MYIFAFLLLVAAFLCAIFCAGAICLQIWQRQNSLTGLAEKGACAVAGLMSLSSFILLGALSSNDFSLEYVASYSDRFLPLFYRLTSFWAGQEGSLLFWGWGISLFGAFFLTSRSYAGLSPETRLWFWLFMLTLLAFFLLLLTGWSNPFITFSRPPQDGQGLNPLLQNPGMIFHPPLLFLGYGAFAVPGCLALAQNFSGARGLPPERPAGNTAARRSPAEAPWFSLSRPFILLAWILLSAGIILGAWWAYMELGWGGYWAWDPVENASLIPWLISTACLHTSVLESRRGLFSRLNAFLISLTVIATFFATYIVRSGAIKSLHAYPDGGVGLPLLAFVGLGLILSLLAALRSPARRSEKNGPPPFNPAGREGLLFLLTLLLLILALTILTATMWPLLSKLMSPLLAWFQPSSPAFSRGLGEEAYNRACLPLFALIAAILAFCPWVSQGEGGKRNRAVLIFLGLVFLLSLPFFLLLMENFFGKGSGGDIFSLPDSLREEGFYGMTAPLSASASLTVFLSLALLLLKKPGMFRPGTSSLGAHGVHLGLALMALGIAFSGPYQTEGSFSLRQGQSAFLKDYSIRLDKLYTGEAPGYSFYEAELVINRDGRELGVMSPQFRQYAKYPQSFTEAATIFSLGSEIYSSLLRVDPSRGLAEVHISLNPLVNWVWLGGILLCLAPLTGLAGRRRRPAGSSGKAD
ncbi:MAG: cytochrome c biogenesis protein CcsA [Deltaproteobacteria bacterium]|jgi:cytochrome c-type biogenesis protein CcmF|nr:cytochrome c biogenesis protein CcsA [Deltaproteobacteria bacterium]